MSVVRIVVIGAGVMGRKHAEYLDASEHGELVALCDSDSRAGALAAEYDVPHFFNHVEALDLSAPDAAIVAAPTQLHEEIAMACIRRGIVPLVEKPIAATLDEGRRLVDEANAGDLPVLVGHHRRHHPRVQQLRQLVKGGAIGRLIGVSLLWTVKKPDDYYDVLWRTRPGGGPVLTNIIHEIDTLRYVWARSSRFTPPPVQRHAASKSKTRPPLHSNSPAALSAPSFFPMRPPPPGRMS